MLDETVELLKYKIYNIRLEPNEKSFRTFYRYFQIDCMFFVFLQNVYQDTNGSIPLQFPPQTTLRLAQKYKTNSCLRDIN